MNEELLLKELEKWFNNLPNIKRPWSNNKVGAFLKEKIKGLKHWRDLPRGSVEAGCEALGVKRKPAEEPKKPTLEW